LLVWNSLTNTITPKCLEHHIEQNRTHGKKLIERNQNEEIVDEVKSGLKMSGRIPSMRGNRSGQKKASQGPLKSKNHDNRSSSRKNYEIPTVTILAHQNRPMIIKQPPNF
jgi:hypothetical protein